MAGSAQRAGAGRAAAGPSDSVGVELCLRQARCLSPVGVQAANARRHARDLHLRKAHPRCSPVQKIWKK
eukprot:1187021-Prorocentrum_minimum.AAC.3